MLQYLDPETNKWINATVEDVFEDATVELTLETGESVYAAPDELKAANKINEDNRDPDGDRAQQMNHARNLFVESDVDAKIDTVENHNARDLDIEIESEDVDEIDEIGESIIEDRIDDHQIKHILEEEDYSDDF
mmetsp:Transcript_27588/g.48756  ORF Transcript_27588/g.48756 Transcript_27588/m.48756 type:complete len:134 (-) Transcript_27588:91-492(-)